MEDTGLEAETNSTSNEIFYSTYQMVELLLQEVQERESGSNEQVDMASSISEQAPQMQELRMPKQAMDQTGVERRRKYPRP